MIVVDTNVLSELMRGAPAPAVLAWLARNGGQRLVTTAINAAEVRYGLARRPDGRRKAALVRAAEDVFAAFPARVLPFDDEAATAYAEIVARRERSGRPIDGFDAQIAAVCRVHRAALATRNVRDFDMTGVVATSPWDEDRSAAPPEPA